MLIYNNKDIRDKLILKKQIKFIQNMFILMMTSGILFIHIFLMGKVMIH